MSPYSPNPKRLIMTVGDSRVGKSTVMRLLIDLFCSQGKLIRAYDHDNRKKLEAYQQIVPIKSINFNSGTDEIIDELGNGYDALAIDMPGQHIKNICEYIDKVNLFKILSAIGWRLTFVQPITHRVDCVEYLEELLSFAAYRADYIVVKNQHFDQQFKLYQDSSYSRLMAISGREIVLGALNKYSYEAVERAKQPYLKACSNITIFSVYRAYIYRWVKNFHQSILNDSLVSKYLGLLQQEQIYDDF